MVAVATTIEVLLTLVSLALWAASELGYKLVNLALAPVS